MLTNMLLAESAKWKQPRKILDQEERVRIALYRTPDLTKSLEKILPSRLNEVIGVSHMKIYVFDDNVLMSGANLSSSYFTNRQDRYILLRDSQNLANYFCELIEKVASFSYLLDKEGRLRKNSVNIDPRTNPTHFRHEMFRAMQSMLGDNVNICSRVANTTGLVDHKGGLVDHPGRLLDNQGRLVDHNGGIRLHVRNAYDTWVFPTVQMGSLGIFQDETCFLWLLANLPLGSCVHFASAYFNLTKEFQTALLRSSTDKVFRILTAAPQVVHLYVFYREWRYDSCLSNIENIHICLITLKHSYMLYYFVLFMLSVKAIQLFHVIKKRDYCLQKYGHAFLGYQEVYVIFIKVIHTYPRLKRDLGKLLFSIDRNNLDKHQRNTISFFIDFPVCL